MSATDLLRKDHQQIKRLEKIVSKCYHDLYAEKNIPFSDIELITLIISEFLDSIHYSREENSYFPCVASYETLKKEIRTFLIEHEFGRRIASNIAKHLQRWKKGEDAREPVARFLRTYSIYLQDHMAKENEFFDKAQKTVLSKEEEQEMFEQFQSVMVITKKIEEMIKQIDFLENQSWFKN
ncbi:MAG: hemerythrin domain-containing protein [Nitrosopumilaceae archaeon]